MKPQPKQTIVYGNYEIEERHSTPQNSLMLQREQMQMMKNFFQGMGCYLQKMEERMQRLESKSKPGYQSYAEASQEPSSELGTKGKTVLSMIRIFKVGDDVRSVAKLIIWASGLAVVSCILKFAF